jgi:hypothetical protein
MHPTKNMNTIIHIALRRDLDRSAAVLAAPMSDEQRDSLCRHMSWMLDLLHHHHVNEDEGVWPRVLGKRPDLQGMVDEMEAEHEALAAAAEGLRAAAAQYAADSSDDKRQALAVAVTHMQETTLPHLDHEEREAMPLVVETLDDADWAYLDKNYFRKGRSFRDDGMSGMWMLDDLDPELAAVLRTEIPSPIVWVMTRLYGGAYDREARRRWGDLARPRS